MANGKMSLGKAADIEVNWEHFKQFSAKNTTVQLNKADTALGTLYSLRAGKLFYNFGEKKESFNHFFKPSDIDDVIHLLNACKQYILAYEEAKEKGTLDEFMKEEKEIEDKKKKHGKKKD